MYSKYKRYESVDEYVRDLTGCTYKTQKERSDYWIIVYLVYFIIIAMLTTEMMDGYDSGNSILGIFFIFPIFPALMLIGLPYLILKVMKDPEGEESYARFKEVKRVVDCIPLENQWKDIDQAVSDMMMKKSLNASEIAEIRKVRDKCFNKVNRYTFNKEKTYEYAELVDKARRRCGLQPLFEKYIKDGKKEADRKQEELKEKQRQEELKAIREAELAKERARQEEEKRIQKEKEEQKIRIEKAKNDLDSNIPLKMIRKKLESTDELSYISLKLTDSELRNLILEYLKQNPGLDIFDIVKGGFLPSMCENMRTR